MSARLLINKSFVLVGFWVPLTARGQLFFSNNSREVFARLHDLHELRNKERVVMMLTISDNKNGVTAHSEISFIPHEFTINYSSYKEQPVLLTVNVI